MRRKYKPSRMRCAAWRLLSKGASRHRQLDCQWRKQRSRNFALNGDISPTIRPTDLNLGRKPFLSYKKVWRPERIRYMVARTRSAVPSLDLLALPSKN